MFVDFQVFVLSVEKKCVIVIIRKVKIQLCIVDCIKRMKKVKTFNYIHQLLH